jgi:hypothetical protein
MAAQLKEVPHEQDELESVEVALEEITRCFVETDADRSRLEHRMMELRQGRDELRRRRARNTLDAYLPPLDIYSIEDADPPNGNGSVNPESVSSLSHAALDALDRRTGIERVRGVVTVFKGRRTTAFHLMFKTQ